MREGEIVAVEVVGVHAWGIDVVAGPARGFIQPIEVSWDSRITPLEAVRIGDRIDVCVLACTPDRFFASIRKAAPTSDPWHPRRRPVIGEEHEGVVYALVDWGVAVRLASGIETMLVPPPAAELNIGTKVRVRVSAVDHGLRRLSVDYVGH